MSLSRADLEAIRAIVREELRSMRHDGNALSIAGPLADDVDEERLREDVQQDVAWLRRRRPHAEEHAAAKAAYRRGESGSEKRWHAVQLAEARDELEWARANNHARFIRTATRKITMLERETPAPYVYRPRTKKP
jgi:hypothetical protein